jgi:adenylylsulfate kinase-like enzyme
MGSMYRVKRKIQKKLEAYHRKNTKPNKEALWVFGMQKAGTSAIASLLAHRTGKTATIDTPLFSTLIIAN